MRVLAWGCCLWLQTHSVHLYLYIRIIGGSFVLCVFFFSTCTIFSLIAIIITRSSVYIHIAYIYIYMYVSIYTETATSVSSGARGRGRHKNTHIYHYIYIYIPIRRGELASRSIKGWPRGNSYSVQYSQWMISALTWLL